ncbi:chemotaxis protein CheA [Clostridium acetireducens DSM 10703]|jgi:two-component system chemotaxis sensor kinase CheA|uniref:Chemotaxis protein CheA n=1 Tax=Clostridium acetireducens DSM 10703 TaxID=1121290 RepID=A0A1E8F0A4_9CLOT|nr:chemotaxis protein CheA [Clostridium acetireducens]OFI06719.1 chemotaxis protein CheA [Clostridium acetireducens DSM 10703]
MENNIVTEEEFIRVDINKIDKLINLIEQIIINKEILNNLSSELKIKYKNDGNINNLLDVVKKNNTISYELQENILNLRMVSIKSIFTRLPRIVRDTSKKCNKKVKTIIEGEKTEIDKEMLDKLGDIIIHLIRNSIDHGIELPEYREKISKNPQGILKISAFQKGNSVIIQVKDDGRGIEIDKIKNKILEKKLLSEQDLNKLSENKILNYIFEPGFSTSSEVTEISGRGAGLDVVKHIVSKLNGTIEIETKKAEGTKFIIKLPITLSIIKALLIKENNFVFAIPASSIIEIIRLKGEEIGENIHINEGIEVFTWRDKIIPVVRIKNYFNIPVKSDNKKLFIVVIGSSEKRVALIIDQFLKEQEIVIKSLGDFVGKNKLLGNIKGIIGVTILGSGKFAHVLDIGEICETSV